MSFYYYHEWHQQWKMFGDAVSIANELLAEGLITEKKRKEYIKNVKNAYMPRIRELNKEYDRYLEEAEWRIPFGYSEDSWDSRAMLYREDYVVTDKEKYIEDTWQHWYNPYNDGRDCTGVWFTSYISVFPLPKLGKTIVYHVQNMDV